jgi:DNA-binding beta-propeller fold protein YncE
MGDCDDAGIICTVAGTGMSVFDGDGRDALLTSFYYPIDVVFQSDGLPIIDDWNNLRGRRIETDGTVRTIIGTGAEANPENGALATETALHHASELAFDPQGRLLVAGDHVPFVFRVGLDQRVEILAGNGSVETSGDGGPALEAGFVSPFGVLPDPAGGFWVSDVDGHTIRYVDADGIVRRVAGTGSRGYSGDGGRAVDAQLDGPTRMALDAAGNLIFCDTGNHVLRRILPNGTIETFAGVGAPTYSGDGGPASQAGLSSPYDIALDSTGAIYVADSRNNVIRLIQPDDGTISTVIGSGIAGFAGDRGPAGEARLRQPSGLALAPDGSLWIADTFNHRVRRVAGIAVP